MHARAGTRRTDRLLQALDVKVPGRRLNQKPQSVQKNVSKTERLSRDRRVFLPGVRDVLPEVRELRHCTKSRLPNKQTRARGGRRRARRIRRPHYPTVLPDR